MSRPLDVDTMFQTCGRIERNDNVGPKGALFIVICFTWHTSGSMEVQALHAMELPFVF